MQTRAPLLWLAFGALAAAGLPAELSAALAQCSEGRAASGPAFTGCIKTAVAEGLLQVHSEAVRNFSCAQDDLGSPILFSWNITLPAGYDACEASVASTAAAPATDVHPDFSHVAGAFLPAGNDLSGALLMSAKQAAERCSKQPDCAGFTFKAESAHGPAKVSFKTVAGKHYRAKGWHTYRKRRVPACSTTEPEADTRSFQVDVIRGEPLVAVIRGFASRQDCDLLVGAGGDLDSMGRAHISGGGFSEARRSYSRNIYPPLQDPGSELMRMVGRMFSITRHLTGYEVYPPGQEPVNAVLYKYPGDEYRPHCDGACGSLPYQTGERIATSIVYCQVAESGGHTSFTEDMHKVIPREGDMLLFAYRLSDGRMSGRQTEHSGCPVRSGRKWIATQWYREGVGDHWNWEDANAELRGGL